MPKFLQNKRLLLAIGIFAIVAFAVSAIWLRQAEKQMPNNSNLLTSNNLSPTQGASDTGIPDFQAQQTIITPDETWITGDNKLYTISFPSDWKPEANYVLNGGTAVTLKPAILPTGNLLPSMHIEATPSDPANPLSERIKFLSPLKLTQSDISFQGIPTVRLSGMLPFKPLPENPNQSLIHKEYTFFEKSNNTYIITFAYYQDSEASKNEQLYKAMLDSIKFK